MVIIWYIKYFIALFVIFVFSFSLPVSADDVVKVWGSTTCQKRILEPGADALKSATGLELKVYGVGTGKGMLALFSGKADVAASSNSLEESIKIAQKLLVAKGLDSKTVPENLQYHTISKDEIVPIVHQSNPLQKLSWEQLSNLNTGKITNWKELGGPDLPVKVTTSHEGSSTKAVFQLMVMDGQDYTPNSEQVKSTRLEINIVSANTGAIGAVSKGFVTLNPGNTKVIKTKPIVRPLGLITIGKPSPKVKKLIDFYRSSIAQNLIIR